MREIEVKLDKPYSVRIGEGLLDAVGETVKSVCPAQKILAVSDSNVAPLYLDCVLRSLAESGFQAYPYIFDAGERSKTSATYLGIIDCLGEHSFKRTDAVVALGGGVVGDIAGFAAATYMRGIDVVQIPTTLLAMIDSSIGGKTGVDLPYGKNLLGAFHQPKAVICDIHTLKTLPRSEWRNGIGEGVKYACLAGGAIADILEVGISKSNIAEFIALCAEYKAEVVSNDEKEIGQRKLLNLGHTVGHAIEKQSGYSVAHGEAVARGIYAMATAAKHAGELSADGFEKIAEWLCKYSFDLTPVSEDIFGLIVNDKKAEGKDRISAVTISGIGNCKIKNMSFVGFERYVNCKTDV